MHPRARTTPEIRVQIATSSESAAALASRFGVSTETVRKWRRRGAADCFDHSSRPRRLRWRAKDVERQAVGDLRRVTRLPLDEFVALVSTCFPHLNRDSVYRILRTSGLARLPACEDDQGTERRGREPILLVDGILLPRVATADGEVRDHLVLSAFDPGSRALHLSFATGADDGEVGRFIHEATDALAFAGGTLVTVRNGVVAASCQRLCAAFGLGQACVEDWWPDRRSAPTPPADDSILHVAAADHPAFARLIHGAVARYNGRPQRGLGGRSPAMLLGRRGVAPAVIAPADPSVAAARRARTLPAELRGAA